MNDSIIRLSDKAEKLTIRCPERLKDAVGHEAIDRKTTVEKLCVWLIAKGLGLEVSDESDAKENAA